MSTGSAPTPKQALGQFVTALENRDLSVLLSLLSKDRRESIEQRLASFLAGLSEQQASGSSELFATSDTRTELNWSHENVRYRLVFVLEGANWRLDELHMGPDPAAPPIAEEEPPPPEPAIRSW